jgi:hypothetical protein
VGDDFGGDDGQLDAHVFETRHWGAVVEILHIKCHEFGIWCGEDAVQEALGGCEAGTMCGSGTGEIKAVTPDCDTDSFDFGLVGAKCGNKAGVGDLAIRGDVGFSNKKDGVGTGKHACANTLRKASEVIGEAGFPGGAIGASNKVAIFKGCAGDGVHDGIGLAEQ